MTQVDQEKFSGQAPTKIDMKLEVVVVPVSDVRHAAAPMVSTNSASASTTRTDPTGTPPT